MNAVHTRIAERLRSKEISAQDVLLNASCLASGTVPFVLTSHQGKLYMTIDVDGRPVPVALGLTPKMHAELRPFPPMAGSSCTYNFEYDLSYSGGSHQLPLMSILSRRPSGEKVYVRLTDDEKEPLQSLLYAQNEDVDDDVWFRIQIDQFNQETLEDFARNTQSGASMCASANYSFASIFETAKSLGQDACSCTEEATTPVPAGANVPAVPLANAQKADEKGAHSQDDTDSIDNPVAVTAGTTEKTTTTTKNFMGKYWYAFVSGAVAIIAIVVGACVMLKSTRQRNSQVASILSDSNINRLNTLPARGPPLTLHSPVFRPVGYHNQIQGADVMSL